MMSIPESSKQFIKWIQDFDYRFLRNEDDVKEKFILPMFYYLCYPEKCYREYPLQTFKSENISKNKKNAQIYFATDNVAQQNANTSLILVESIEPHQTNLNNAIEQAKFYSINLNTLLFIVTNGYQIKVFKRLYYYKEESIFDI